MKAMAIAPAQIVADAEGLPFSPQHGDRYHPRSGALAQARHVFLSGNGLPERWQGRHDFVVLETGFGLGNNFLATWQAWRDDPARSQRLHYVAIEKHPPQRDDLLCWHDGHSLPALAQALIAAWPPLTPDLHRVVFDGDRVQLSLAFGEVADWLRELVCEVDACYLDGFAPARNPAMWQPRLYKAIARLAAPGATAATWSAARGVRDGLAAAGFSVRTAPGQGGKRDITLARYEPAWTPRRTPARRAAGGERHAVIVGAGLAGCASAWALAEQGWSSTVLDRHAAVAGGASGNTAGVFHGALHVDDGPHARFNRAAALQAAQTVDVAVREHGTRGSTQGLLRLEFARTAVEMQALAASLGLPAGYVEACDATAASDRAGLALPVPAWFYAGGGWVEPARLAQAFLERAAPATRFRGGVAVQALRRAGERWQLLDANDRVVEDAGTVILANGGDALRLLGEPDWPLVPVRGQTTGVPLSAWGELMAAAGASRPVPRLPLVGNGYLLPPLDDHLWCGATADADDAAPELRAADHARNLARLQQLLGLEAAAPPCPAGLAGRVGWRCTAADRLPVIGAVPALTPHAAPASPLRLEQPRLVPRTEGLYVHAALASRGITWAALGARCLAAAVSGAPLPLAASLRDAVDPARFVARAVRRAMALAVR